MNKDEIFACGLEKCTPAEKRLFMDFMRVLKTIDIGKPLSKEAKERVFEKVRVTIETEKGIK